MTAGILKGGNEMEAKKMLVAFAACAALCAAATPALEKVVFVGGHPDDFAAQIGLALLMRGTFEVHVVDFTHGERGCGKEKFESGWTKAKRTKEEESVCAAVGAKLHWLDEVDGDAYACRETCAKFAEILKELQPRAIITHWPLDQHLDHVMAFTATMKAIHLAKIEPEIYLDILLRSLKFLRFSDIIPIIKSSLCKFHNRKLQKIIKTEHNTLKFSIFEI